MKCTEKKFETYFVVVFFVEKMYEDKSVLGRCCFLCWMVAAAGADGTPHGDSAASGMELVPLDQNRW